MRKTGENTPYEQKMAEEEEEADFEKGENVTEEGEKTE